MYNKYLEASMKLIPYSLCDQKILRWGFACLIPYSLLLSSCVSRNQTKLVSQTEGSQEESITQVEPSATNFNQEAPTRLVTSDDTKRWPRQPKSYEIINGAKEAAVIAAYVDTTLK